MRTQAQIALALAALSHMLARFLGDPPGAKYTTVFFVSLLFLTLAVELVGRGFNARDQFDGRHEEAMRSELSISDAKERALSVLRNPSRFACTEAPFDIGESRRLDHLGALTKEFFSRYREVRMIYGDMVLSRDGIGPAEADNRVIRIGSDTEHAELAIWPDSDRVIELDESAQAESPLAEYQSVYHLILERERGIHE